MLGFVCNFIIQCNQNSSSLTKFIRLQYIEMKYVTKVEFRGYSVS